MKRVLRVEHVIDGTGPYSIGNITWQEVSHINNTRTPEPGIDTLPPHQYGCLYGFSSRKQLSNWFTDKELTALKDLGFIICTYKVPEHTISYGCKQVTFIAPDTHPLYNWLQTLVA